MGANSEFKISHLGTNSDVQNDSARSESGYSLHISLILRSLRSYIEAVELPSKWNTSLIILTK